MGDLALPAGRGAASTPPGLAANRDTLAAAVRGALAAAVRGALAAAVRGALAAAVLVPLGAVVAGCGLILHAGDYQLGACPAGDCACGGFVHAAADCATCSAASCCAEGASCRGDAPCAALYDCLMGCAASDGVCRRACAENHPAGDDPAAVALGACSARSCADACGTCGELADWYAGACPACVESTCCDEAKACAGDEVCSELQGCYRACTYPTCPLACDAQIAASTGQPVTGDVVKKFGVCVSAGCRTQCSFGAHWACAGSVTWPAKVPGATVKLTVNATSFITTAPFTGATVSACPRADLPCAAPITTATTGPDGSVTLLLPSGFDGYLDATAPDTLESLVYLAWPVTSDSSYALQLGPYSLYESLVTSGGGTVYDTKGALFVYTQDCFDAPAPGVHLAVTPAGISDAFYFVNGSAVPMQNATTTDAIGGFANVDPGTVTLTGTVVSSGHRVALFTAQVRAKTLTYVTLTPTP